MAWTYVDDRRTHQVAVAREVGRTAKLVFRESLVGGSPPDETFVEEHVLHEPWEEKMRILALETRLAHLGNYYRSSPTGWLRVRPAQARDPLDLAPIETEGGSDTLEFHHFMGERNQAASVVGLHQDTPRGRRSLLVRLDYEFPETEGGRLEVIHARLPPVLYRSALASVHVDLAERRFRKPPRDTRRLTDARTWAALRAALDAVLARLVAMSEAQTELLRDPLGRPLTAAEVVVVQQAVKATRGAANAGRQYELDFELDPTPPPVEAKAPEVLIEELSPDVFGALGEPRLVALHERFLTPATEEELLTRGGVRPIQVAMRELRASVRPDEQHLVSLLEASLLLRYSLKNRVPVDPDVIKRVKHARAYL